MTWHNLMCGSRCTIDKYCCLQVQWKKQGLMHIHVCFSFLTWGFMVGSGFSPATSRSRSRSLRTPIKWPELSTCMHVLMFRLSGYTSVLCFCDSCITPYLAGILSFATWAVRYMRHNNLKLYICFMVQLRPSTVWSWNTHHWHAVDVSFQHNLCCSGACHVSCQSGWIQHHNLWM